MAGLTILGKCLRDGATWFVEGRDGVKYELTGITIPDRMENLQVRVVGTTEESFGMGVFDDANKLAVQHIKVV